jgi:AMP phosphorylase
MGKGPADLREKATSLAGILLEMVGIKDGKHKAEELLRSSKAEQKLREIIGAQGGNPQVKVADVRVGDKKQAVTTDLDGEVLWVNNEDIAKIAKEAGAPKEKGAGVMLQAKLGDHVKKGDTLFDVYAERDTRLESALKLAANIQPIGLSRQPEDRMLVGRIPAPVVHRKAFTLER